MARCDKCAHSVFAVDSSLLKKKGCFLRSWRGEKAILNTDVARLPQLSKEASKMLRALMNGSFRGRETRSQVVFQCLLSPF